MAGKRHRWASAPLGRQKCKRCGLQRRRGAIHEGECWWYTPTSGPEFYVFLREPVPPCPGRPEEKKP